MAANISHGKDFSQGKVWRNIISQAIPLTLAQLVQLLYSVVDRIYIGHLASTDSMALTGIGLTFPIITIIAAFTSLFGMGGAPLFSISRGEGNDEKAARIMGNVFSLLVGSAIILMIICYLFRRPILFLFGASEASYVYANEYLRIYLIGTIFTMITSGMNGFINAMGYPKIGMMTTMLGAISNLILDPILIFGLHLGVSGAALATIISQFISMIWVMKFLRGNQTLYRLERRILRIDFTLLPRIISLGMAGFIVQATNSLVQIVCNASLQTYGGDLYVGVMTILNSVRELANLPVHGLTSGSMPVIGFNFGAKKYLRVKQGIRFAAITGISYTILFWIITKLIPTQLIHLFSNDQATLTAGPHALSIYFFGFCFMAFQFAGQSTFQALGFAKRSIFFSLFRKVIIVVPLTLLLPRYGLGVDGVFWAEPISNLVGGLACFITMYFSVYRKMDNLQQ